MSTETIVSSPSRRSFLNAAGAMGLAAGASAFLAGCGGSNNNNGSSGPKVSQAAISQGFKSLLADETSQLALLQTILGSSARPAPTFTSALLTTPQTDLTTFIQLASMLENTETGAYLAAATNTNLQSSTAQIAIGTTMYTPLEVAGSIVIVEGRHAGFLNSLLGRPLLTDPTTGNTAEPTGMSLNVVIGPDEVVSLANAFLGTVGQDATYTTNLNGGPALPTDSSIMTDPLDTILNYALFSEYVGVTFYNLNVPKFFP